MSNAAIFEQCRSIGHAWFISETTRKVEVGAIGLVVHCERCNAERIDRTDIYGNLIGRRYELPAGYKYSSLDGEAMPSRHEFRMMMLKRRGVLSREEWAAWQAEAERLRQQAKADKTALAGEVRRAHSELEDIDEHLDLDHPVDVDEWVARTNNELERAAAVAVAFGEVFGATEENHEQVRVRVV